MGHLEASGLSRHRGVWQDTPGTTAPPAACPAPPAQAAAACRLRQRCPARGLAPDTGPCARGARGVRGSPGPVASKQASCPAIAPGRRVSAARLTAMPPRWLCLLWQTPEPECPQRPPPRLRLLPLPGDRGVSLWWRAPLPEYAGAHGPLGAGGLAGSLELAGPSKSGSPRNSGAVCSRRRVQNVPL